MVSEFVHDNRVNCIECVCVCVTLWCGDNVGDIQWRKGSIPWNRPPHSHAVSGDWTEDA